MFTNRLLDFQLTASCDRSVAVLSSSLQEAQAELVLKLILSLVLFLIFLSEVQLPKHDFRLNFKSIYERLT